MFSPKFVLVLIFPVIAAAEVHSLTLQQTLELAAKQNPDVVLARLDAARAVQGIRIAEDPFRPKVYGGSGLAYTYGYPSSIEGNAPSIFETRTDMSIYNRPQTYEVRAAKEIARGSQLGVQAKADEVEYRAADLFLTASLAEREGDTLNNQIPSLQKVVQTTSAGVEEGSELPLNLTRAQVNLAVSQQRLESDRLDIDYDEMMLAVALGFPPADRVKPVDSDLANLVTPPSEEELADRALKNNHELQQMQSNVLAKEMDVRSYKAARLPKLDLVAQYSLFSKQNYQNYFQKFQRNNAQLGVSITIPILLGSSTHAYLEQTDTDLQKLRIQMDETRNQILTDVRHDYQSWQKAESLRDLARKQLDLARQELTVLLAQIGEGRVPMSQVEQARLDEGNRWMDLYDAEAQVTRAKLAILRRTGNLLAALQATPTTQPAANTQQSQ